MLGEQYAELKGKATGQRVLDIEGPTMETSVSVSGTMKGIQVQELLTFTGYANNRKGSNSWCWKGSVNGSWRRIGDIDLLTVSCNN